MNILLKEKNVLKVYPNTFVNCNGEVVIGTKTYLIYEVTPLNVVQRTNEFAQNVYNKYISAISALPSNIKIITLKDNLDISKTEEKLKQRLASVKNENLKAAISLYLQNFKNMMCEKKSETVKYYFAVNSYDDIQVFLENLRNVGLNVRLINDTRNVIKIVHSCIMRGDI